MGTGLRGGSLAACLPRRSPVIGSMAPSLTLVARLNGGMCEGRDPCSRVEEPGGLFQHHPTFPCHPLPQQMSQLIITLDQG